tara:strand:- start:1630 stop:1818 length:189 start_codon:yes stop_codon:yes gene_type:complete
LIVLIVKSPSQIAETIVMVILKGISLLINETNKSKIKNDNRKYVIDKDNELRLNVLFINVER